MLKHSSTLLIFASLLLLCGCQNGCNFNWDTVLDTQTVHRITDGISLKITFDKVKETHYNLKWRILKGDAPQISN